METYVFYIVTVLVLLAQYETVPLRPKRQVQDLPHLNDGIPLLDYDQALDNDVFDDNGGSPVTADDSGSAPVVDDDTSQLSPMDRPDSDNPSDRHDDADRFHIDGSNSNDQTDLALDATSADVLNNVDQNHGVDNDQRQYFVDNAINDNGNLNDRDQGLAHAEGDNHDTDLNTGNDHQGYITSSVRSALHPTSISHIQGAESMNRSTGNSEHFMLSAVDTTGENINHANVSSDDIGPSQQGSVIIVDVQTVGTETYGENISHATTSSRPTQPSVATTTPELVVTVKMLNVSHQAQIESLPHEGNLPNANVAVGLTNMENSDGDGEPIYRPDTARSHTNFSGASMDSLQVGEVQVAVLPGVHNEPDHDGVHHLNGNAGTNGHSSGIDVAIEKDDHLRDGPGHEHESGSPIHTSNPLVRTRSQEHVDPGSPSHAITAAVTTPNHEHIEQGLHRHTQTSLVAMPAHIENLPSVETTYTTLKLVILPTPTNLGREHHVSRDILEPRPSASEIIDAEHGESGEGQIGESGDGHMHGNNGHGHGSYSQQGQITRGEGHIELITETPDIGENETKENKETGKDDDRKISTASDIPALSIWPSYSVTSSFTFVLTRTTCHSDRISSSPVQENSSNIGTTYIYPHDAQLSELHGRVDYTDIAPTASNAELASVSKSLALPLMSGSLIDTSVESLSPILIEPSSPRLPEFVPPSQQQRASRQITDSTIMILESSFMEFSKIGNEVSVLPSQSGPVSPSQSSRMILNHSIAALPSQSGPVLPRQFTSVLPSQSGTVLPGKSTLILPSQFSPVLSIELIPAFPNHSATVLPIQSDLVLPSISGRVLPNQLTPVLFHHSVATYSNQPIDEFPSSTFDGHFLSLSRSTTASVEYVASTTAEAISSNTAYVTPAIPPVLTATQGIVSTITTPGSRPSTLVNNTLTVNSTEMPETIQILTPNTTIKKATTMTVSTTATTQTTRKISTTEKGPEHPDNASNSTSTSTGSTTTVSTTDMTTASGTSTTTVPTTVAAGSTRSITSPSHLPVTSRRTYTTVQFQSPIFSTPPPVYIRIGLRMSWFEFCTSRSQFISEIREIIQTKKGFVVHEEQFILTTGDCGGANVIMLEGESRDNITIELYLVDNDGKIDITLTTVTSRLIYKGFQESDYFKDKIVSVQTVRKRVTVERLPENKGHESRVPPGVTMVIVIASMGGVCCVALIILQMLIHRRVRAKKKQRPFVGHRASLQSMDHVALGVIPKSRPNSGYWNPALCDTMELPEPEGHSHIMNFSTLANFCMDNTCIHAEFQKIPFDDTNIMCIPIGDEDKNRFANVLPHKHSRVKLKKSEDKKSDYINANYVNGYMGQKNVYIATQSPLVNTVEDFWRMIWEQQCRTILMLNPLTQQRKPKQSTCYWPDSTEVDCRREYGDYIITLKTRDVQRDYVDCTLEIMDIERNLIREVHHFWLNCWPDTSPPEPLTFIKFVLDTRPHYENSGSPVVVHCGPGTGRTGVFIAVDMCMRMFEDRRRVDILSCVNKLRSERAGSVQTKEQYNFIYQALNEYAVILSSPSISTRSSVITLHAML